MAYPTITYTFAAATVIDPDEVNANFTDCINSVSDGNTDLRVANAIITGTMAITGATTLTGNLTVNGKLASQLTPSVTSTHDLGSSGLRWETVYADNLDATYAGIGTASGTYRLAVYSGTPGAALNPNIGGDDLVIANSDNAGLSIITPTDKTAAIYFGDSADQDIAGILYEHTPNKLRFRTGNTSYMTMDSTGSIGIKTASPEKDFHVQGNGMFSGYLGLGTNSGYKLSVHSGTAGSVTAPPTGDDVVVEHSDSAGISILTPANKIGSLYFGDPDDADVGGFQYLHITDTFYFRVSGDVNTTVNATGVGIGTISALHPLDVSGNAKVGGNLGVGTAPSYTATVYSGSHGGSLSPVASGDDLVISHSESGGVSILTPNNKNGSVYFGDQDNNDAGAIQYIHTTDTMYLRVNDSPRMAIDSSGNVGIGTITPDTSLDIWQGSGLTVRDSTGEYYLRIPANNATARNVLINGNIGIKTSSALYPLDVSGNAKVSGNLGVGTYPGYTATVYSGSHGGSLSPVASGDDLVISHSDSGGMSILTPNNKNGSVYFGDQDNNDAGAIQYIHTTDTMYLRVNDSPRMAIDSNGNVGIGTLTPNTSLDIWGTGALILPRITTAQRDALTAVNGMMIYNTTTNALNGYVNGTWSAVTVS